MATNSIYKELRIKDRKNCSYFVTALENAEKKSGKDLNTTKCIQEIRGNSLKEMFNKMFPLK